MRGEIMNSIFKVLISGIIMLTVILSPLQLSKVSEPKQTSSTTFELEKSNVQAKGLFKPKPKPKPKKPTLPKNGFKTGAAGEVYLNKLLKADGHKTYATTKTLGKRVVDAYVKKDNWGHESKVGYASKTKFIEKQIKKDAWLVKEDVLDGVKWHFFKSAKTGKVGASKPLRAYLKKNKIPYEIHTK